MSDIDMRLSSDALFDVVEKSVENIKASNSLQFEFCIYKPHGRHEKAHQSVVRALAPDLRTVFFKLLNELKIGYEIGLSSRVTTKAGAVMHLPMIDFKGLDLAKIPEIEVAILNEAPSAHGLSWFTSGRSFHAYGHSLIDQESWLKLMGGLLIIDGDADYLYPDSRWVGHRIQDGFACLRWTNETGHYASVPTPLNLPLSKATSLSMSTSKLRRGTSRRARDEEFA